MILSVEEASALIDFNSWDYAKIERKLKAVEQTIRAYTNNNFQVRGYRVRASIVDGVLMSASAVPFVIDDTVQISGSQFNDGLYTITGTDNGTFTVSENIVDENDVLVTKVEYPADVIDCCINLLEWENSHRSKVGVQSETLSRHSVTYFNMDGSNSTMGYPVSLLGCLKAYRKARF